MTNDNIKPKQNFKDSPLTTYCSSNTFESM